MRGFETRLALTTYMRLSPVDLLVCDFDCAESPAGDMARALHADAAIARPEFQVLALASTVDEDIKRASILGGIDEVIVKPMSPRYLLERVLSRLRRGAVAGASSFRGPERRRSIAPRLLGSPPEERPRSGDNVIPLFGEQHQPVH